MAIKRNPDTRSLITGRAPSSSHTRPRSLQDSFTRTALKLKQCHIHRTQSPWAQPGGRRRGKGPRLAVAQRACTQRRTGMVRENTKWACTHHVVLHGIGWAVARIDGRRRRACRQVAERTQTGRVYLAIFLLRLDFVDEWRQNVGEIVRTEQPHGLFD